MTRPKSDQSPPSPEAEYLRDLFKLWLEACGGDEDAPDNLATSLLGNDLEEILEGCERVAQELRKVLQKEPSWDALETTLYGVWAQLAHVMGHWSKVVAAVQDDDLSIESYFEENEPADGPV